MDDSVVHPGGSDDRRQQDHPGQFDDDGDRQRRGTGGLRRGHHLADVVHGGARPGPELLGTETQRVHEQRQHTDGKCSAQRHERHGEHCVLMPDAAHSGHRADRRGAADGKAGGDQQGSFAGETEQAGHARTSRRKLTRTTPAISSRASHPRPRTSADADLQAQQHDPGTHQVLSGEVQAGPGAPRGQDRRARYIGGEQAQAPQRVSWRAPPERLRGWRRQDPWRRMASGTSPGPSAGQLGSGGTLQGTASPTLPDAGTERPNREAAGNSDTTGAP